jgi:hypothetical protein
VNGPPFAAGCQEAARYWCREDIICLLWHEIWLEGGESTAAIMTALRAMLEHYAFAAPCNPIGPTGRCPRRRPAERTMTIAPDRASNEWSDQLDCKTAGIIGYTDPTVRPCANGFDQELQWLELPAREVPRSGLWLTLAR